MSNSRFLPIEPVLISLLKEAKPDLVLDKGSAVYDTIVHPISIMNQLLLDKIRVSSKSQFLQNYGLMLPEDLDALAANFLIYRKQGSKASGIQRILFRNLQAVSISESAEFQDSSGRKYRPVAAESVSRQALSLNYLSDQSAYYVDVSIVADQPGSSYTVGANQIIRVIGVPGALSTYNPSPLIGGSDPESNEALYNRIKSTQSDSSLSKPAGIKAFIHENFPAVQSIAVRGYGDPGMNRDVVYLGQKIEEIFQTSYCRKVNLPTSSSGQPITDGSPYVSITGFIYDVSGLDLRAIPNAQGDTYAASAGMSVRFLHKDDPDRNTSTRQITGIVYLIPPGETIPVVALRLNDVLLESTSSEDRPYTLAGVSDYAPVHLGGKVDVYVETSSTEERSVIIGSLPFTDDGIVDIPVGFSGSSNLFENGQVLSQPLLTVVKIEEIDPVSGEIVQALQPQTDYALVRKNVRGSYTPMDYDVIQIRGTQLISGTPTSKWGGSRLKITYLTDPLITAIQDTVSSSENRNISTDISVIPMTYAHIDVIMKYRGDADVASVQAIVQSFINTRPAGAYLTVSQLLAYLAARGVDDVSLPVTFKVYREVGDSSIEFEQSSDRVTLEDTEKFLPENPLSIEKID